MLHASRAVSDIIKSCVMAGVKGGHARVELTTLTAALITMSRYATLQDLNNTPYHQDQGYDYKSKIWTETRALLNHS